MNRLLLLIASWCVFCGLLSAADAKKPNILILLADDLGYADLSVQGSRDIPTPHIDSIAKNGIRCTSGYVSSCMCSPSRAGLLTGRSQSRFGHEINWEGNGPSGAKGLPVTERTFPQLLKAGGYRTGVIGKWHLGNEERFHPLARGFDEFFGFLGGSHDYLMDWRADNLLQRNRTPIGATGKTPDDSRYLTPCSATRRRRSFIGTRRSRGFSTLRSMPRTRLRRPRRNSLPALRRSRTSNAAPTRRWSPAWTTQ